jgi:hypothetical protein
MAAFANMLLFKEGSWWPRGRDSARRLKLLLQARKRSGRTMLQAF